LVTGDDTEMVRVIERTLGSPLERRTVTGFDYSVPAPRKDAEFARPPRQPRPVRKLDGAKKNAPQRKENVRPDDAKAKALKQANRSNRPAGIRIGRPVRAG